MKKNYNEPVLSIDKFSVIDIVTTSSQPDTTPQPTLKEMLGVAGVSSEFLTEVDVSAIR